MHILVPTMNYTVCVLVSTFCRPTEIHLILTPFLLPPWNVFAAKDDVEGDKGVASKEMAMRGYEKLEDNGRRYAVGGKKATKGKNNAVQKKVKKLTFVTEKAEGVEGEKIIPL